MRTNSSALAVVVLMSVVALAGCEAQKSETPLSPSVAGPIPGVDITAPRTVEPALGTKLRDAQQPIRLTVSNSSTTGVRPISYTFEVASDSNFTAKVFGRGSVPPGADGKTSVVLDRLDIGRTYYWRARAEDGANTGPYMTAQFELLPKPFIAAPVPASPINNAVAESNQPTLHVRNSDKNAAVGSLVYEFQVSSSQGFTSLTGNGAANEGPGETTVTLGAPLPANATQYWRARAMDAETLGDWSVVQVFRTPNAVTTPSPGGGGGGGGGGTGANCAANNGPAIIACISAKYPERLAGGVSSSQRVDNMSFLRDRIIEAGLCGGNTYGWNLKRGGPELSIDVIAWKRSDGNMGVDIGFDYDNIGTTLRLVWSEVDLNASYTPYTNSYSCK